MIWNPFKTVWHEILREFNFADCQFFAFRENKFSRIQTLPLGTNVADI